MTFETVIIETPASLATSLIFTTAPIMPARRTAPPGSPATRPASFV
jgi:hypothetical protein